MPSYRWNKTALRYVDERGRFVSRVSVRQAIDQTLRNEERALRALADQLRARAITISEWQREMRASIKNIHTYNAAAARGGFGQLTQSDYGSIGGRLRVQYAYLDRFAGAIEAGLPLDGRFLQRAGMYAEAGRATYDTFDRRIHKAAGYKKERSYLGRADHCDDCIRMARLGWVAIGTLIPIGSRQCLSKCKCRISYKR